MKRTSQHGGHQGAGYTYETTGPLGGLTLGSEVPVGGNNVLCGSHVGTDGKHPWGCGQTAKMARKRQLSEYISFWLEESICDGRGALGKRIGMSWEQECGGQKDGLLRSR